MSAYERYMAIYGATVIKNAGLRFQRRFIGALARERRNPDIPGTGELHSRLLSGDLNPLHAIDDILRPTTPSYPTNALVAGKTFLDKRFSGPSIGADQAYWGASKKVNTWMAMREGKLKNYYNKHDDMTVLSGGMGHGRKPLLFKNFDEKTGITSGIGVDPERFAYRGRSMVSSRPSTHDTPRWVTGAPEIAANYAGGGSVQVYDAKKLPPSAWTIHLGEDTRSANQAKLNYHPRGHTSNSAWGASPISERVVGHSDLHKAYMGNLRALPSGRGFYGTSAMRKIVLQDFGKHLPMGDFAGANPHLRS